jgi:hypothetical protein
MSWDCATVAVPGRSCRPFNIPWAMAADRHPPRYRGASNRMNVGRGTIFTSLPPRRLRHHHRPSVLPIVNARRHAQTDVMRTDGVFRRAAEIASWIPWIAGPKTMAIAIRRSRSLFLLPHSGSSSRLREPLAVLKETPEVLRRVVTSLPQDQGGRTQGLARQVIQHPAASELIAGFWSHLALPRSGRARTTRIRPAS